MTEKYPSLEEFLNLPTEEVAKLVRASGSKVVVFPINGTRRWFMLEYGDQEFEDPIAAYMDIAMQRHIELYKLFFDHGVDTLLTPVIGPEILATRDGYMQKIGAEGLARLVTYPEFLSFYEEYGGIDGQQTQEGEDAHFCQENPVIPVVNKRLSKFAQPECKSGAY